MEQETTVLVVADKDSKAVLIDIPKIVTIRYQSVDHIMALFHAVVSCAVEVWPDDPLMQEWVQRNQTGKLDPPEA